MLKVNLSDGKTDTFNLDEEGERVRWREAEMSAEYQRQVRGATLIVDGRPHALSYPRGFRRVVLSAEAVYDRSGQLVAEVASFRTERIAVKLVAYVKSPNMTRIVISSVRLRHPAAQEER